MPEIIGIAGRRGAGKSRLAGYLGEAAGARGLRAETIDYGDAVTNFANRWRTRMPELDHPVHMAKQWVLELPPIIKKLSNIGLSSEELQQLIVNPSSPDSLQKHVGLINYLSRLRDNPKALAGRITREHKSKAAHQQLLEWVGSKMAEVVAPDFWTKVVMRQTDNFLNRGADVVSVVSANYLNNARGLRTHKLGATIVRIVRPEVETREALPTERELELIHPDIIVSNRGSLTSLGAMAVEILDHADTWRVMAQPIHLEPEVEVAVRD